MKKGIGYLIVLCVSWSFGGGCTRESAPDNSEAKKVDSEQWVEYTLGPAEELDTAKISGRLVKSITYEKEGFGKIVHEYLDEPDHDGDLTQRITYHDSRDYPVKIISFFNRELTTGSIVEYENDSLGNPILLVNYDVIDGKSMEAGRVEVSYGYDGHGNISKSTVRDMSRTVIDSYTQDNFYNSQDQIERRIMRDRAGNVQSEIHYTYSGKDVTSEIFMVPDRKIKRETKFKFENGQKVSEIRMDEPSRSITTHFEYVDGLFVKSTTDDGVQRKVIIVKRKFKA